MRVWCAQWFERGSDNRITGGKESCALKRRTKGHPQYQDHEETLCEHVITLTVGYVHEEPTCPECLKKLEEICEK